jgi:KEOPS complex subunit Pcc1
MNVFEACFTLTEESARIIADSLKPEIAPVKSERSKTTVKAEGNKLKLKIEAEDLHSLRAAVNTYLKWIIMCEKLAE